MSEYIEPIHDATDALVNRIEALAARAQMAIPGIFDHVSRKYIQGENADASYILAFNGGENANCYKFTAMIYAALNGDMGFVDPHFYDNNIFNTPGFRVNKKVIDNLSLEDRDAINERLEALSALARDELKEKIESFDIHSIEKDDAKFSDRANSLFNDVNLFIQRAGYACTSHCVSHVDPERDEQNRVIFRFVSTKDCSQLIGTIASKLAGIGSITFSTLPPPSQVCTIAIKSSDLAAIPEVSLTKIRGQLLFEAASKSPESLRQEINNFDIEQHLYLLSGQPKQFHRGVG